MEKLTLIGLLALLCWACQMETSTESGEKRCAIMTSELDIPLDGPSLFNSRFNFGQYQKINGADYYFGYSFQLNQLEWFDLGKKKAIGKLPLNETSGRAQAPSIFSFYVHNLDSIFLLSLTKLQMVNAKGKVLFSKKINQAALGEKSGIDFNRYSVYNTPMNDSPLYFSAVKNQLFFPVKANTSRYSKEKFKAPLCGAYDLEKDQFQLLPVPFPDEYRDRFYPFDKARMTFLEDRILYSFSFSSKVYIYDHKTQTIHNYDAKSRQLPNEAAPLKKSEIRDNKANLRHISLHSDFLGLHYDEEKERYYRLAFAPYEDHLMNGQEGKRGALWLLVYDPEFEVLKENRLEDYSFRGHVVIPSKGMWLFPSNFREEILEATFFNLNCPAS